MLPPTPPRPPLNVPLPPPLARQPRSLFAVIVVAVAIGSAIGNFVAWALLLTWYSRSWGY